MNTDGGVGGLSGGGPFLPHPQPPTNAATHAFRAALQDAASKIAKPVSPPSEPSAPLVSFNVPPTVYDGRGPIDVPVEGPAAGQPPSVQGAHAAAEPHGSNTNNNNVWPPRLLQRQGGEGGGDSGEGRDGTNGGSGKSGSADAAGKKPWYKSLAFQYAASLVGLFLLSFIMLVAIRPPFVYTKPEDELHAPSFSAAKAAWWAFGATVAAGVGMGILAAVTAAKAKK